MADDSFFIVIEGMDGAGKSSIARQLHNALSQAYADRVTQTYEPHDDSASGKYIRSVLAKQEQASPLALAYAFALNRIDHLDKVISPFLAAGDRRIVICDRYVLSSLVYQSTADLSMDDIYDLNSRARQPDLTACLRVSPYNCYARLRNRPQDRELFENNLRRRDEKYQAGISLLRKRGENIVEVDANPPFGQVFGAVLNLLKERGPDWLRIQPPLLLDDTPAETREQSSGEGPFLSTDSKPLKSSEVPAEQVNQMISANLL